MCGITGFIDWKEQNCYDNKIVISKMIDTLNHRGPNNQGFEIFTFPYSTVAFAQSRLSIIDLSNAGHQPMNYKNYSIVFNGEIYNYKELKAELLSLGHFFISDSDTEVILHAYEQWGDKAIDKFIGMFAIVLLDKTKNTIIIIRDRAGVKPLYYFYDDNTFLFSSELKSFHKHPKFKKVIDENSLTLYFENVHHGYIPAPKTIFKNTFKLLPGHILKFNILEKKMTFTKYWDVIDYYKLPKLKISFEEAKQRLEAIIRSASDYRMISDVPVGVFLSGGIDSTLITAILQKNRLEKLKTFTIGFEEGNNEAPFAREIAKFIGTDHKEYICTAKEAQKIIPTLPYYYDEPFADSSAIPTILVSQLAQKDVTVVLSADGGDEIFAGYTSYTKLMGLNKLTNKIPDFLKPLLSSVGKFFVYFIPSNKVNLKFKLNSFFYCLNSDPLVEIQKLFKTMNSLPKSEIQKLLKNYNKLTHNPSENDIPVNNFKAKFEIPLAIDYKSYLQNDILTKVDRATMSASIEGREPLLDHRIIEFAAQLPYEFKWNEGISKFILKDIVYDYLPKEMMDRPKAGFSLPIYDWLRGDLAYLIDKHLNKDAIAESGFFNEMWVSDQVNLFKKNKLHYQPIIWKLLMFQMWYQKWMK